MKKGSLTLVTGGVRSGKSSFAEGLLMDLENSVLYIATAKAFDKEMEERIKIHQLSRPREWTTHEGYRNLHKELRDKAPQYRGVLLDCVTIMLTNLMLEYDVNWDTVETSKVKEIEGEITEQFQLLIKMLQSIEAKVVLVTNEVGFGIVPEYPMARIFRDIAGRINQYLAREADEVFLTVCGISMKIK